eukprot:gene64054-87607_t
MSALFILYIVIACGLKPSLAPPEKDPDPRSLGEKIRFTLVALVPPGSSREQALLSLGTPSATATFDAEVFYYISQTRQRSVAFMKPSLKAQSVLAVYFTKDGVVDHLAHYSLQDGRVVDMLNRTTPTGGVEKTFLMRLLSGGLNPAAAAQQLLGGPGMATPDIAKAAPGSPGAAFDMSAVRS